MDNIASTIWGHSMNKLRLAFMLALLTYIGVASAYDSSTYETPNDEEEGGPNAIIMLPEQSEPSRTSFQNAYPNSIPYQPVQSNTQGNGVSSGKNSEQLDIRNTSDGH